jgi:hypothetical protein
MGLPPVHLFIGPTEGANVHFHFTHQPESKPFLLLPCMVANRASFTDPGQGKVGSGGGILTHIIHPE